MALRFVNPAPRYFDNEGHLLSYGRLYFYEPGTLVAKNTFSDSQLTIVNSSPVELFGDGLQPDIFGTGGYRVICTDRYDREIFDRDNVSVLLFPFSEWNSSTTYGEGGGNIVTGSDGNYYVSISADNQGNDPISSPSEWQLISFFLGTPEEAARVAEIGAIVPVNQAVILGTGTGWTGATLAAIAPNFIGGLETSVNVADPDHDIDITAGRCTDSTNTLSISIPTALTKRIDATWAAGTGNGGLASGATLANNTTYHVFAVIAGAVNDVMLDSSITCANGVANNDVTSFRRIASIRTNGSANIVKYFQSGDEFTLDTMAQDVNTTNPGETAVTVTLSVPAGITVIAKQAATLISASTTKNGWLLITSLRQADVTAGNAAYNIITFPQTANTNAFGTMVMTETNTSAQIRYRVEVTTTGTADFTVQLNTLGWTDRRGR